MTRLTPEQQALAADPKHLAFAREIAGRMARKRPSECEAMEAAALYGLVRAAALFDPAQGVAFTAFARERIAGAVIDAARELMPKGFRRACYVAARGETAPQMWSFSTPVWAGDWDCGYRAPTFADLVDSGEEPVGVNAEYVDFVEAVTGGLEPNQRAAVRLYYTRGLTMRVIADRLGMSESRVCQMIALAYQLIRERLEARDGATTAVRPVQGPHAGRGAGRVPGVAGERVRQPDVAGAGA